MSSLSGHLYCDRFGNPCKIDMWYYSKLNNKNKIVIGPSGSGKSFWLNNYILQSYELSHDVMIVDIGGSYRSMIELNRGKYFDSTDQSKFAFNPFCVIVIRMANISIRIILIRKVRRILLKP